MSDAPTLDPSAVAELLRQLAFLSAVLGGFAATFLGTLLSIGDRHPTVNWAVGALAFAAVGFILTAILSAFGSAAFNVEAPPDVLERRRAITLILFFAAVYPLLLAIGLSGWSRSRAVGIATTAAAVLGSLLVLAVLLEA